MSPAISRFLVLGAGGHGRVVADLVRAIGHEVVGYSELDSGRVGATADATGTRVVLDQRTALACVRGEQPWPLGIDMLALGVGDNTARARLLAQIGHAMLPPLVHPGSWVSGSAWLGPGTVVLAGAVINTGATLEGATIVNSGAVVEHDCVLKEAVHISPNATLCGAVSVGARSWVAAAAVIVPGRTIGADCVVGAGAVVIRDVPDGCTVVGNPARPIHHDRRRG
jgi:sugar O-acyltransferase (sialic acid O-acetyltransferase NeuD family)